MDIPQEIEVALASGPTLDPQTISIDFDDTFTTDPELWRAFAALAKKRGHKVICASLRMNTHEHTADLNDAWDNKVEIVLCSHNVKDEVCRQRGHRVDIWIDDMPFVCKEEEMASFVTPVPMKRVVVRENFDGDDCITVLMLPEEVDLDKSKGYWEVYQSEGGVLPFVEWLNQWVPGIEVLTIDEEVDA